MRYNAMGEDIHIMEKSLKMTKVSRIGSLGLAVCLVSAAHASWNFANDFSTQNGNPNGAWSYGCGAAGGGAFSLLDQSDWTDYYAGFEWFNMGGHTAARVDQQGENPDLSVGDGTLMAGLADFATVRWTAPTAGTYSVKGKFFVYDNTTENHGVRLYHNSTNLLVQTGLNYRDQVAFDFDVTAFAGDTIDFVVGETNEHWTHSRLYVLDGTIAAVPEPTSMAVLGLGALALIRKRRK